MKYNLLSSIRRLTTARLPLPMLGLALLGTVLLAPLAARANDHIFPPAAAAKNFSDFDRKGFLINGKRIFLVSAGMEYARVPRALWRDRLLRLRRAGFNCVEVYTFWDWHEPQQGRFDFSGDHDLDAYLKMVHALGMYAICRVGPYYCAEWTGGGYPLWLRFQPGLRVRENNAPFLADVDRFFEKLMPIVAANQINRGGAVILVQLENEGASWGTEEANPYFTHLRQKALSLGLQVPYFFSGLHHSSDPAGEGMLDDPRRPNPWFSTEFWCVWYSKYGSDQSEAATYDRRIWKIIAHGGSGYNDYMAHGGSNFGYTNSDEDAASYDYGAAVGQAGDLRPLYYTFKRAAQFARSFQDILENSTDATGSDNNVATGGVAVNSRRSPAGTIVFLDNAAKTPAQTQITAPAGSGLPVSRLLTLAPGEIMPIVRDFALAPAVTLCWAPIRILGIAAQGNTTTLVVYGPVGSPAELHFTVPPSVRIQSGAAGFRAGQGTLTLQTQFGPGAPTAYAFTVGAKRIRVLAMTDTLALRTWFVDVGSQTTIVCGPSFVGEARMDNGYLRLTTERPWQETADVPTWVYGPEGSALRLAAQQAAPIHPDLLALAPWQARDASQSAVRGVDDHAWLAGQTPPPMGADGDLSADAWYRASISVPKAGGYMLQSEGGDRATVFVDGARVGSGSPHAGIPVALPAGLHQMAVFAAHDGRSKLFGYTGPLDTIDRKGLAGPVTIQDSHERNVTGWRLLKAAGAEAVKAGPPAANAAGWQNYQVGEDAFHQLPGFAWFQATLPPSAGASRAVLRFGSADDNSMIFVNGRKVGAHHGWNTAFDVPVMPGRAAVVTVFVENTAGAGGLDKPVTLATQIGSPVTATGWKLRGGPGDPFAPSGWKTLGAGDAFAGPAFFRTTFSLAKTAAFGPHPIWRVVSAGLGHGSVWVNGHNLGRYPEKVAINGLYIPECWLHANQNSLAIYDEDGRRPDRVTVAAEAAASRDVAELAAPL